VTGETTDAAGSVNAIDPKSNRGRMTLSRKIVIGLVSGVSCGLFFGE
jgi:hypothetical protein